MALQLRVRDRAQRVEHIDQHAKNSTEVETFHGYQAKATPLKRIRIASDYLVYRMANFRTQTAQLRWLRENSEKRPEFFSTGEENVTSQQVQHTLLLELAKKGTQNITPVYEVLKKEPVQIQALLITDAGVVVNGNRRLAAMRQLYNDSPTNYKAFSHVECVVLPSTVTPRDLEEIEVQLQMARETKLPYSWIDQGLAVRKLLSDGVPMSRVRELMYLDEDDDVQSIITQLNEAEMYLAEYQNAAKGYEQVETDKQIFQELEKSLKGQSSVEQETRRLVAHVIIGNNDEVLAGRVYNYRLAFGKHHDDVVEALSIKYELNGDQVDDSDEFEIDIPGDDLAVPLDRLRALLKNKAQGPELAKTIADTVDNLIADKTEEKSAKRSLTLAQKALENVCKIDASKTPEDLKSSVIAVLEQLDRETINLIGSLTKAAK